MFISFFIPPQNRAITSAPPCLFILFLMILMREGDTPEGSSPKGLGWPLHREKKKNEMRAGNPSQTQKIGQY